MTNGIDTSKWQASKVDYYEYKKSGGEFVFLRIGYNTTKDKCFELDYEAARKAGLKVGVYFYTLSQSMIDSINDATRVLGWLNDRPLDFPIAYDIEDKKQRVLNKDLVSALYIGFRNKIEASGVYDSILYTYESFYNSYFNKDLIKDDLWIAKYANRKPVVNQKVCIWQYSSSEVDTKYYKGKLDRNYMLIDKFEHSREQTITSLNPYPQPLRILKLTLPRQKGNDVRWLQWELGFPDDMIDGIYGKITNEAVLNWQKKYGLKVDGKVGSATVYSLKYN